MGNFNYKELYGVVVICKDEQEQKRIYEMLQATWFWADSGLDTGDICEQEVIKIDYAARPREFYEQDIIPAMGRTLERCLNDLQMGIKRRVPQVDKYATFDKRI